jgi:DnaJ-class molecular chaperone
VTLTEAVLGGPVRVPTPDGPVMLTVPKGSSSGKVLRLKGRGFHKKGGGRGDLFVTLMVELPEHDEALIEFAKGWQNPGNPRARMGV